MSADQSSSLQPTDAAIALARFVNASVAAYPDLRDPFDSQWRSPCETGTPELHPGGGMQVPWQPKQREDGDDLFAPLARALDITIHADITAYYGSFWSGGLEASSAEGPVSLIQLWNAEDATRLIENLLGHAIAKQRAKSAYSVFFACTAANSELFLSIENHTGHVLLERPGYAPERTIAGCVAEFLDSLQPAPPEQHPERAAFLLSQLNEAGQS